MFEARVHQQNDRTVRKLLEHSATPDRDGESQKHVDIGRLLHLWLPLLPVRRSILRAQEEQAEEEEAEGAAKAEREQRQHRVAQQQSESTGEHLKNARLAIES